MSEVFVLTYSLTTMLTLSLVAPPEAATVPAVPAPPSATVEVAAPVEFEASPAPAAEGVASPAPIPAPTVAVSEPAIAPVPAPNLPAAPRDLPPEPRPGLALMWAGAGTVLAGASMRAGFLWGIRTEPSDPDCPQDLSGVACAAGHGIAYAVAETARITTVVATTGNITAAGLAILGGGAARRGRWLAWSDAQSGRTRNMRTRLGWGLFGAGLGLWGATRIAFMRSETFGLGAVVAEEVGWYASVPLTSIGLAMAVRGVAYRKARRKYAQSFADNLQVSMAPTQGGGTLSISGRF